MNICKLLAWQRLAAILIFILRTISLAQDSEEADENATPPKPLLLTAVREGKLSAVAELLASGAPVDAMDDGGRTALIEAAEAGSKEMVNLLIEKGADVNAQAKRAQLKGSTALMLAAKGGHNEIVEALIAKGARLEAVNHIGNTPLLIAATLGRTHTVELLLSKGAKLDARNNYGWTALMMAAQHGHNEVIRTMIAKGADVNAKNGYGWTVLAIAGNRMHENTVKLLIGAGADIGAALQSFEGAEGDVNPQGIRLLQKFNTKQ